MFQHKYGPGSTIYEPEGSETRYECLLVILFTLFWDRQLQVMIEEASCTLDFEFGELFLSCASA